jgi:hypothetical protein
MSIIVVSAAAATATATTTTTTTTTTTNFIFGEKLLLGFFIVTYDRVRLCRPICETGAANEPIFHPPDNTLENMEYQ